jgi:hypothetical protein
MRRVVLACLICHGALSLSVTAFAQESGKGLASNLSDLRDYRSMRVASVDRPGNDDFLRLKARETTTIASLQGPGEITHLWTTIDSPDENHLKNIVIRIYWDGNSFPSVECPIGDFYGLGHGKYYYFDNPVQAIGTDKGMNAFWPMPFAKSARVEISNESDVPVPKFYFYVDWSKFESMPPRSSYFHAQYRQEYPTVSGRNYLFCETKGRGHFVGVSLSIHTQVEGWWGEGDDIFTIDGEKSPSLWGTGSEDYFAGAWGFGKVFFNDYFGMPLRTKMDHSPNNFWNVYRLHLEAPVTFRKSIKVEMEHGDNGVSNRRPGKNNNYSSVAYFYVDQPQPLSEKLPTASQRVGSYMEAAAPPGIIEATSMERSMKGEGVLETQAMNTFIKGSKTWLNENHLWRIGAVEGEESALTFSVKEKMEGPSYMVLTSGNDYGRISISLDDKVLIREFDGYSEAVEPVLVYVGLRKLEPGKHTMKVKVLGKNSKSKGFLWGIDYLRVGREPLELEKSARLAK